MKIKYISCDGETVVEEEIVRADFYLEEYFRVEEHIIFMECQRPEGDIFTVPCSSVTEMYEGQKNVG